MSWRSEQEVTVQVSLAKSSLLSGFLDLFLEKFVDGKLAFRLCDGYVENSDAFHRGVKGGFGREKEL